VTESYSQNPEIYCFNRIGINSIFAELDPYLEDCYDPHAKPSSS